MVQYHHDTCVFVSMHNSETCRIPLEGSCSITKSDQSLEIEDHTNFVSKCS
jgi:hypothetical protein